MYFGILDSESLIFTQFSQEWVVSVQKGGRKAFNKSINRNP